MIQVVNSMKRSYPVPSITRAFCLLVMIVTGSPNLSAQDSDDAAPASATAATEEKVTREKETEDSVAGKQKDQEPPTKKVEQAVAPVPQILQPYRVQLLLSFETDALLPAAVQGDIAEALRGHLAAEYHQMWDLKVNHGDEQVWFAPGQLASMNQETLPQRFPDSEYDKIFLTTIAHDSGSYTLHAREWDSSSRSLGSLHVLDVRDRREIVPRSAEIIAEAFRPLAELEIVDDQKIEFLIRGGEFLPRNPKLRQFAEGDFLVPYMRFLDRKRNVQKIQFLPWTYMKVESVQRSRMQLSITSAFGNPVAGKRRRVEMMAMRIRPYLPSTEIMIYPRGERQNPLVGVRCEVMDRFPTDEDPVDDRLKLETDRRGIVTVPVVQNAPLQFLYVYSGQALLAKVPFIPGYEPRLEVEVPDDRARLNVEGEVSLLQSELIDIVATREVLMARTRGAAKAKRWDDVSNFLSQLQDLPTLDEFSGRIDSLEVRAVQAAKNAGDRVAEIRVKRLCSGITEAAQKHLDPFRIAEFRREMGELRGSAQ